MAPMNRQPNTDMPKQNMVPACDRSMLEKAVAAYPSGGGNHPRTSTSTFGSKQVGTREPQWAWAVGKSVRNALRKRRVPVGPHILQKAYNSSTRDD